MARRIISQSGTRWACPNTATGVDKLDFAALQVISGANDFKAAVGDAFLEQRRSLKNFHLLDHVEIDRAGFKIVGALPAREGNRRADVGEDLRELNDLLLFGYQLDPPVLGTSVHGAVASDKVCLAVAMRSQLTSRNSLVFQIFGDRFGAPLR